MIYIRENIVKKQHYVPRFYLRKFSKINDNDNDKKNKILVFDKKNKKKYSSSVYNIACENYFYDIENGTTVKEKQVVESAFSDLETKFSILLNKLINRCEQKENYFTALMSTKKEREEFSFYIIMQLLRTKKYRKKTSKTTMKLLNDMLSFLVMDYELKSKDKKIDINEINVGVDEKLLHLEVLMDENFIEELTGFITNSCWIFIHNKTEIPFATSDNPICRVPRIIDENYLFYNQSNEICMKKQLSLTELISPFLEINFPLSPDVSLKIIRDKVPNYEKWKKLKNRLVPVERVDIINAVNQYQFSMAYEKVFINPNYEYLINNYYKDNFIINENLIF